MLYNLCHFSYSHKVLSLLFQNWFSWAGRLILMTVWMLQGLVYVGMVRCDLDWTGAQCMVWEWLPGYIFMASKLDWVSRPLEKDNNHIEPVCFWHRMSRTPDGRSWTSNVFPLVQNLRAVIWFHFTISSLVLLPTPIALSVLFFFFPLCFLSAYWHVSPTFFSPENSSVFFH